MGGSSSKSSVEQTNEFFNKTTNTFVSENSQKVSASALNINRVNLKGADLSGCRTFINQNITSDVIATGVMSTQNIQDLKTKLQNDAKSAIDNAAATKSGFLSPAIANSSTATTNLKTKVTNIIENTMMSKNVQDIFASVRNINVADNEGLKASCDPKYKLSGPCGAGGTSGCDFVVDQNIKSSVVAKGVADALTKALEDTIVSNTSTADVKQTATTTNAGADDLVKAFFEGYAMLGFLLFCLCCCCCIIILGGAAAASSSGGASSA
jgi:hypothetical protein